MATLVNTSRQTGVTDFTGIDAPGTYGWLYGTLDDADTGGGVFAIEKPKRLLDKGLYIFKFIVNVTTAPTGGSLTVNIGQTIDSTTSSSSYASGANYSAKVIRNHSTVPLVWLAADNWITISTATGAAAGIKGNVLILYRECVSGMEDPNI